MQADTAFLEAARSLQAQLLVNDEGLAEVVNDKAREDVEAALQRAFKIMEARTERRDLSLAIQVLPSFWWNSMMSLSASFASRHA